jgi:hypothetical protein
MTVMEALFDSALYLAFYIGGVMTAVIASWIDDIADRRKEESYGD